MHSFQTSIMLPYFLTFITLVLQSLSQLSIISLLYLSHFIFIWILHLIYHISNHSRILACWGFGTGTLFNNIHSFDVPEMKFINRQFSFFSFFSPGPILTDHSYFLLFHFLWLRKVKVGKGLSFRLFTLQQPPSWQLPLHTFWERSFLDLHPFSSM